MRGSGLEWICDGCGKQGTWGKGWRYFDGIPSPANSTPKLISPLVVCSEGACVDAALAKAREVKP